MHRENTAKRNVIASMCIYGTIGLFVRSIPLASSVIAMARGVIGSLFLLLVLLVMRSRLSREAIRKQFPRLCLTGAMLGFNWILLFEAYRFTTVATATLCYYMAPIILVALSPFVFRERLSLRKLLCVLAALLGMVFVSGAAGGGLPAPAELKGVLLALSAAVFYALIVISNKRLSGLSAYERTIMQLLLSALVLLPYNLLTGAFSAGALSTGSLLLLLTVGILHTGVAYYLYFGSMERLRSQTLAILSYIDPVVAVLLSALILREPLGPLDLAGAVLILGAAILSELPEKPKSPTVGG